jgi:hypothetical protein
MSDHLSEPNPGGWIGGFAQLDPAFAYSPTPDLSSLPMYDNMANIDRLQRQADIRWPEFSWLSDPGESDPKRVFQMFAPDISRIGYTDRGRVYSIICPQQGLDSPALGSLNVEITVTKQRGWVDEDTRELACDMEVVAKIWFGPGFRENIAVKLLWKLLDSFGHDLPISKAKAIQVDTNLPHRPDQPIFPILNGMSPAFEAPDFARHDHEAWSVGHIEVEIGSIKPTGVEVVDDFNQLLLDILNTYSGNMLATGNTLTWNLWLEQPKLVDRTEWRNHAQYWRDSIDTGHGSPEGERTPPRFADGSPFVYVDEAVDREVERILHFLRSHR